MTDLNALYCLRIAVRGAADAIAEDGGDLVYGLASDERGVDFAVEGDASYRIEVRCFELKEGE